MAFFEQPHCAHCGALLGDFDVYFGNYCPGCHKLINYRGGIVYY